MIVLLILGSVVTMVTCSGFHCGSYPEGKMCGDGSCIPDWWICDGQSDCSDGSDEIGCGNNSLVEQCVVGNRKYLCANNETCIDLKNVCNSIPDCPDRSDESTLCSVPFLSCSRLHCSHECVQLPVGPKCLCPRGYNATDGIHCEDINECQESGICDQKCSNTPGSYECYCEPKYVLQEDKKHCKAVDDALMILYSKSELKVYTLESRIDLSVVKDLNQVVGNNSNGNTFLWKKFLQDMKALSGTQETDTERTTLPPVDYLPYNINDYE